MVYELANAQNYVIYEDLNRYVNIKINEKIQRFSDNFEITCTFDNVIVNDDSLTKEKIITFECSVNFHDKYDPRIAKLNVKINIKFSGDLNKDKVFIGNQIATFVINFFKKNIINTSVIDKLKDDPFFNEYNINIYTSNENSFLILKILSNDKVVFEKNFEYNYTKDIQDNINNLYKKINDIIQDNIHFFI